MDKKISVLVIEDEADIRDLLRRTLRFEGFDVYSAADGSQGLEIALRQQPDVILLDWVMPKMDGMEVLSELRRDERTKDIIVFMLTAKNMMKDVSMALTNGANDYIVKPFDGDTLGSRIMSMLQVLREQKAENGCDSAKMTC